MEKNLIKLEGIYMPLEDGEKFNIFCAMEINIESMLINIKNFEINQENPISNNVLNFSEKNYNFKDEKIINDTLNIINNLKSGALYCDIDVYLQDLINFLFHYIYNEYYSGGTFTFSSIKLI